MKEQVIYSNRIDLSSSDIKNETNKTILKDYLSEIDIARCVTKNQLTEVKADGYNGIFIDPDEWVELRTEDRILATLRNCVCTQLNKIRIHNRENNK